MSSVGTGLSERSPKTMVEMQSVVDRLGAELRPASDSLVTVPLERTVPNGNGRGVILVLSKASLDMFGQVTEYEIPAVIRSLVHDGQQPFSFSSNAVSSKAISRLVERRRRLRVDVYVARTSEQWTELLNRWRVTA